MAKQDEEISWKINLDLKRTIINGVCFNSDYRIGENKLYNVLNAYAMFDNDIKYA